MSKAVYYSPAGNPEVWVPGQEPEGYVTEKQWLESNQPPAPEPGPAMFHPGSDYDKCGEDWWKVRFSKKDFLLLCGVPQIIRLEAAIASGNAAAKAVHTLLMAAEYIDVTDPATVQIVMMLASDATGNVLSTEDVSRILQGVKYEEAVVG